MANATPETTEPTREITEEEVVRAMNIRNATNDLVSALDAKDPDTFDVALAVVSALFLPETFTISANISAISDAVSVTVNLARALELAAAGLRETVGNKISSAVHKDAKTNKVKVAGDCTTAIEDGTYSFGGGGRSSDPVSKREHEIAVDAIKASIRSPENTGSKKLGDYDVDALADRHAESHPEIQAQAVKDVAASVGLAVKVDLSSLVEPTPDAGDSS